MFCCCFLSLKKTRDFKLFSHTEEKTHEIKFKIK